jgi:hypothetical protein
MHTVVRTCLITWAIELFARNNQLDVPKLPIDILPWPPAAAIRDLTPMMRQ